MVVLKLTIPIEPNAYHALIQHPRVARVAALSGGYRRQVACAELAKNSGMIASFSRALLSDLRVSMNDEQFDEALARAIDEIYRASTDKTNP
jgi:fructose-bisphosphate aldolase class I